MQYVIMFVEQGFACNKNELVTNHGEKRFVYWIEANNIDEAYHEAIRRVRNDTKELVRLNYCRLAGGQ